jgi:hypothetical protein
LAAADVRSGISFVRFRAHHLTDVAVGLLPVGIAAAWIPVRGALPGTDVALVLVLAVGAVSIVGGRWASVVGAVGGAAAFDVFDTPPYGQLMQSRGRDVVTTVVLVGVGLTVGELCVRLTAYRVAAERRRADFAVLSGAAGLMAFGEASPVVVAALAGELVSRIGLVDCEFVPGPPSGERPCVARDGTFVQFDECGELDAQSAAIDLPVWNGSEVVGCYRMALGLGGPPSRDRLLTAIGIADQAGAALAADRPELPPEGPRPRRLRLVR